MISSHIILTQRKFREVDEEESYFDCDDGEDEQGVNGMGKNQKADSADSDSDLHRTERMFSLSEQDPSQQTKEAGDGSGKTKMEEETKDDSVDQAESGRA